MIKKLAKSIKEYKKRINFNANFCVIGSGYGSYNSTAYGEFD